MNATTVVFARTTGPGMVMQIGGKKCLCIISQLTRRSRVCGKNAIFGSIYHEQQVLACCQTHSDYRPSEMPLKLAL